MRYKRSIMLTIGSCMLGQLIALLLFILAIGEKNLNFAASLLAIVCVTILVVGMILLPDFDYTITNDDNWIIFEINENDHKELNRKFKIVSKSQTYITLDDGVSTIEIPYNADVYQHLKDLMLE